MKLLTNKQQEPHEKTKYAIIVGESLKINMLTIKDITKVIDHCHYTGEYRDVPNSMYNLKYNKPKEITLNFLNGLNYDYYLS